MQVDPQAMDELRALGETRSLARFEQLFRQGEPPGPVALVETGRLQITASSEDGVEVLLAVRGPGELVGEFAALDGLARSASATALGETTVTLVPGDAFVTWVRSRPDVMWALLMSVVAKARETDVNRVELSAGEIDHRVVLRLIALAGERGEETAQGRVSIRPALSDEELAGFTGATAEAVARSLHRLGQLGIVERSPGELVVADRRALSRFSAGEGAGGERASGPT